MLLIKRVSVKELLFDISILEAKVSKNFDRDSSDELNVRNLAEKLDKCSDDLERLRMQI